jgi:hypothetical protein
VISARISERRGKGSKVLIVVHGEPGVKGFEILKVDGAPGSRITPIRCFVFTQNLVKGYNTSGLV